MKKKVYAGQWSLFTLTEDKGGEKAKKDDSIQFSWNSKNAYVKDIVTQHHTTNLEPPYSNFAWMYGTINKLTFEQLKDTPETF